MVYAIVRAGGRQEKVSVGDVLEIDRVQAAPGDSVELPVLLLVDGTAVTSDKSELAKATVTVEVVAATKGPKINILKYKNKTGYRKRQGHRQQHTQVKVTGIDTGSPAAEQPSASAERPSASAEKPSASAETPTATAEKPTATAEKPTAEKLTWEEPTVEEPTVEEPTVEEPTVENISATTDAE